MAIVMIVWGSVVWGIALWSFSQRRSESPSAVMKSWGWLGWTLILIPACWWLVTAFR